MYQGGVHTGADVPTPRSGCARDLRSAPCTCAPHGCTRAAYIPEGAPPVHPPPPRMYQGGVHTGADVPTPRSGCTDVLGRRTYLRERHVPKADVPPEGEAPVPGADVPAPCSGLPG
ncbi:hypothetical protein AMTR_s00009p00264400 [Amborella trichopoda]|uniref:Uncharacterized protein n=1 Tax=Amborella trichopoda TaxID=13333 RepID=W1NI80_AMBTC|nr:hypothetical protein AMTR_s00009p00264400 [Amborella trichopoda]